MKKALKFLLLLLLLLGSARESSLLANDDKGKDRKGKPVEKKKVSAGYEVFDQKYFTDQNHWDDPAMTAMRSKAANTINETDAQQRYVDFLSPSDLNRLPIGLKKKI